MGGKAGRGSNEERKIDEQFSRRGLKGLSGEALRELRNLRKLTQRELSVATGVGERSISKYEHKSGGDRSESPSLDKVLLLIDELRPNMSQLIKLLSLDYLKTPEIEVEYQGYAALVKPVSDVDYIRKLLKKYDGMRYCCYYQTNERVPLQRLIITKRLCFGDGDYLMAPAEARDNTYDCRVTCSHNQFYTFFDFESRDETIGDSVHFALPYPDRVKGHCSAGVGALAHISYPSGNKVERNPCFELMAIVSDELGYQVGKQYMNMEEHRIKSLPKDRVCEKGWEVVGNHIVSGKWLQLPSFNDEYLVSFTHDYLFERSKEFYKSLDKLVKGNRN